MTTASEPPILDAQGVQKRFGAVVALRDARLTVRRGEVVALMGANGAGKSTFVKILTGALRPDGGTVRLRGKEARISTPAAARRAGMIPVYQEPSLIPDLDVADNLRLGDTPREPFLHWVSELGVSGLRLDDRIRDLPLASLRILDLARALAAEPDLLMLDEMTAALPTNLVERVLRVVRAQADAGRAVIYISHRFPEIAALCDRATVLRDGVTVGDLPIEPGVEDRAVELMLGAALTRQAARVAGEARPAPSGPARVKVSDLAVGSKLGPVSLELQPGEVLGVVGLEGQGQEELFEALGGLRRATGGTIEVEGRRQVFRHP
ncbi:MAG TPA: ATP-binding cassette domain-containing protein, partial [Rubellimicrobium sp.]|nr:ATP-binding cassette domain-containing protein [Rubellimicrobium sp.]